MATGVQGLICSEDEKYFSWKAQLKAALPHHYHRLEQRPGHTLGDRR